jgi:4-hydroxy-tetrahydrodipicolinate reductase
LSGRIRVCVAGATGWVGRGLCPAIAASSDLELTGAVARAAAGTSLADALGGVGLPPVRVSATVADALEAGADVFVDYTSSHAVREHVETAIARGVAVVVGSSGLTDAEYAEIDRRARERGVGVLAAGNFAITAVLLQRFADLAARHVPQWEIIDYGKAAKPDAPSGTARELAEALAAVRLPATARPVSEVSGIPATRGAAVGEGAGVQVHALRLPSFVLSCEAILGLPDERLTIRHDAGSSAAPYVAGTLLAARRVVGTVGLIRGLDTLID